jgi:hypothetical protein
MPERDPQNLFSLHETMRTLRPRKRPRARAIGVSLLALFLAALLSFYLFAGALASEQRLASMRENMAATAASSPSLMDSAVSSIYRTLCPIFTDCEVAQIASTATATVKTSRPDRRVLGAASSTDSIPQGATAGSAQSATPESAASPHTTIIERIVERVLPSYSLANAGGITEDVLNYRLNQLDNKLSSQIFSLSASLVSIPNSLPATGGVVNNIALSQRIDNLSGTSLSNITVSGVSGLTAADIPSLDYLPLSGGTLSGDLTLSGTLSAGALAVTTVSSGGAVEASYFTATSTSQASDLQNLIATNATTSLLFVKSLLSSPSATIGALTATSTLAVSNTASFFGPAFFGATGTTTISAAGTISTPSLLATAATAYSASIGGLTATSTLAVSSIPWGLLSTDGTGTIVATSSPTAAYFTATSTTQPSIFPQLLATNATTPFLFVNSWISSPQATIGSLTLGSLQATSTTATSTFAGGITGPGNFSILQNGNVGVGTAGPTEKLTVAGGILANGNHWIGSGQRGYWIDDYGSYLYGIGRGGTNLELRANGQMVVIANTGNVGIGTTTP